MEAKLYTTLISLAIAALLFGLIWFGWKARLRDQQDYGKLAEVPERYDAVEPLAVYPGTYVSTTKAGDWLERIAVESLGYKAEAKLFIFNDAVLFERSGAQALWIPLTDMLSVRTEAGMSGKFVEKDGLVVLTWNFNGKPVDTGFRTRHSEDKESLISAIEQLLDLRHT